MNKVVLIGRLTRDPDIRYTQGPEPMAVARYTLAVNRPRQQDGSRPEATQTGTDRRYIPQKYWSTNTNLQKEKRKKKCGKRRKTVL